MRFPRLFLVALLCGPCATVCGGCAIFAPPKEDTAAVRMAIGKMDEALAATDKLHDASLVQFRDQLLVKSFEAIQQATLDEINKAAAPTTDVAGAVVPGVLTPDEVAGINAKADVLRAKAVESINKAYAAGLLPQPRKDLGEVYAALRTYFLTRLNSDEQKAVLVEEIAALVRGKETK